MSLDRALAGQPLVRFEAPRLRHRPFSAGTLVEGADAVGKHCLVRFDDGRTLHTHMRMTGSWHLYRPGERWRKQRAAARAVVEVAGDDEHGRDGWVAVCFAAPVVELTAPLPALRHHDPVVSAGRAAARHVLVPDLSAAGCRIGVRGYSPPVIKVWPGEAYPLGATYDGVGTNFALFSEVADRVELCLFDD